jgi:hypothetical protein
MFMWKSRYWLSVLAFLASLSAAEACGPDFPTQLLDRRADILKAYPANSFAYEASHLVPAPEKLKPVETGRVWYDQESDTAARLTRRSAAETAGLSEAQAKTITLMRTAVSGDVAYGFGQALPEAVRLYTAGAIDFNAEAFAAAATRFHAVLDLPEAERRDRAVWAAYMLGKAALQAGQLDAAAGFFAQTRKLAAAGGPDPLGLGAASYGEEARQYFEDAKFVAGNLSSPEAAAHFKREIATAVQLYAQQAATGSDDGLQSLRIVAQTLFGDSKQLEVAVQDITTQRLLVAYALARIDNVMTPPDPSSDYNYHYIGDQNQPLNPVLPALIAAIQRSGNQHPEGADRLAALAYRCGQYELAEKIASLALGPLSDWVHAKIALRRGDLAGAAAFYSSAAKSFKTISGSAAVEPANGILMTGETGVLALARGEYIAALDHLFDVADTYWGDVAYIAERVLTSDELKAFIDTRVPPVDLAKPYGNSIKGSYPAEDSATAIRRLLARRLMREGRYREALTYFPEQRSVRDYDESAHKAVVHLESDPTKEAAANFTKALEDAKAGWFDISRARALYQAALIARHSGMEILGYEEAPDYAIDHGAYGGGYGRQSLTGPLITEGERQRFAESAAKPNKSFHYRYIAAAEAGQAADLVPARSQAFAAILCNASGWLIDRDPEAGAAPYRRYVKEGPHVPWAAHFARACPEPDFDAAANLKWRLVWWDARHFVGRNLWPLLAVIVVFLGVGALIVRSRRVAY